jgi:hypothetical protein
VRKRGALLLALFVAGLAACIWLWSAGRRNWLTVENHSGQAIAQFRVTVGGRTIEFRDVPDGAAVSADFPIRADDHFAVEGRFADGTKIGGDFGYVTSGMAREHARFTVQQGGKIDFQQSHRIAIY